MREQAAPVSRKLRRLENGYHSILALSVIAVQLIGDGWRLFLLFTVVLLFVQFLGLLRRFEA